MNTDVAGAAASIKLSDMHPKMELRGKIVRIELFGAFVDVGAEREGLLHISQLRKERTNRVEDVVNLDQEVTTWVRKVDPNTGRIDLTLIQPLKLDWDEIKVGMTVNGKVSKLEKFGAFIDIGAERQAFIHVRELMSGYVSDPSEVLKPGQEVEAKVIAVDRRKKRIDLSLKALEDLSREEEEPEVKPMSTMEAALRAALASSNEVIVEKARQKKGKTARDDLEAVLERTRQQHATKKN